MKKRLLGILLVLCMVLAIMPMAAMAADGNTVYLNPSSGNDSNDGTTSSTAVKTLNQALALAEDGGTIYILGQVSISGEQTLSNVTFKRGDTFTGTLFYVGSGSTLTLNNVTIDGCEIDSLSEYGANLVYVYKGTLNIGEGAALINNMDSAVYIDTAIINMTGGEISNNTTENDGGAILMYDSTANLSGGEISGNTTYRCGGAICALSSSTINLSGTVIQDNTSEFVGGAIYVEGWSGDSELNMTGGAVINNGTYDYQGGGIYAAICDGADSVTVKVSGGKIAGNVIGLDGDDQYENAITVADYYYDWEDEDYEPGEEADFVSVELSGSPEISGDISLNGWYGYGPQITVTGKFTPVNPVTVGSTYGNYVLVTFADGVTPSTDGFKADGLNYGFVLTDEGLVPVELILVRFYQSTPSTSWTPTEVYVYPNQPLDPDVIPAAAEVSGYQRTGWVYKVGDEWVDWDMDTEITERISLYEKWERIAVTGVTLDETELTLTEGETAQLTATVAPEDALDQTVTWSSDKEDVATVSADGLVTAVSPGTAVITVTTADGGFTASCTVTVEAEPEEPDEPCDGGENCPSKPYFDVNQEAWYHEHVDFVIENGYMIGTSGDPLTFSTEEPITRAQVVQTLYQMEGEPEYTETADYPDLNTEAWYMAAVSWATENGIVEGRDTGVFDPDVEITREELVTVIYRYVKEFKGLSVDTADGIPDTYTDSTKVGDFAEEAFAWAIDREIINGITATTLEPQTDARRCEMAKIISMLCKAYPEIP